MPRKIVLTVYLDGTPSKVSLQKVVGERKIQIVIGGNTSTYQATATDEIEHFEGPILSEYVFLQVKAAIRQYYPKI